MASSRLFVIVLLLALTASAANAYTIVMRDGRRIEVPNEFTVTNSTLTYEVGDGIQITMQLNTVDIAATEQANGAARGSFLMKGNELKAPVERAPQTRRASAERSITNADLEKYRRARVEGEREYENRRQELGLPSLEERRREVAEIEDRTVEQVRSMRAQEEAYWRSRADALRAEMAANEAQMESLCQRSEGISFPAGLPFDTGGFGITAGPFTRFRGFRSSLFPGFLSTPITPFPTFPSKPFSGFLSTPITPFPTFPFTPVFRGRGRTPVFGPPGVRMNPRPFHMKRGSHR